MSEDSEYHQAAVRGELVLAKTDLSRANLERHTPNYLAIREAIDSCIRVDEVADIGDKALAAAIYYRQSQDTDNEIKCSRMRVRAERRLGELLAEMETSGARRGRGATESSSGELSLRDLGVEKKRSHRAQTLAAIPPESFEEYLAFEEVAQPTRIIRRHREETHDSTQEQGSRRERSTLVTMVQAFVKAKEQRRLPPLKQWREGIGPDGVRALELSLPDILKYLGTINKQLASAAARKAKKRKASKSRKNGSAT